MNSMSSTSLVSESLRITDPRKYGSTRGSPQLTKKARALAAYPSGLAVRELTSLLQEHLINHEEDVLREALAACPDQKSYEILFGFLAREACTWLAFDEQIDPDIHTLFGIPLTLHAPEAERTHGWCASEWGPGENESHIKALRRILENFGITAGLRDLTILPHLVDPVELLKMDFSDIQGLAPGLVHQMSHFEARKELAHRPWQPSASGAQYRVLIMAGRSRRSPQGLESHNEACTMALNEWANKSFGTPKSVCAVASSPERLVSLITGKGQHMFNCAKLVHLLGLPVPEDSRTSPFVSLSAISTEPTQGELQFRCGESTCSWNLHGRTDWDEDMHALSLLLPDNLARFVRVQLGLQRRPKWA